MCKLFGGKNGNLYKKYELSYEDANRAMQTYLHSENQGRGAESLRVSLYLDNAKCGDLHLFVIDFDKVDGKVDTQSAFFQRAKSLADRVTRSQEAAITCSMAWIRKPPHRSSTVLTF